MLLEAEGNARCGFYVLKKIARQAIPTQDLLGTRKKPGEFKYKPF